MDIISILDELHKERAAITSVITQLEALVEFTKRPLRGKPEAAHPARVQPLRRKRGRPKGSRNRRKGSGVAPGA